MAKSPLDVDPFASTDPTVRIDHLHRMRRATHRSISRHGEALWIKEQAHSGRFNAPPGIDALPAHQRPAAMAADEAARLADAYLYGLDEAATAAAAALGASMVDHTPAAAGPDIHRVWSPVADPPTRSGLLRWASGISYDSTGVPLIAAHWGPLPEGTWLAFWADNRIAIRDDISHGRPRHQAELVLREFGPLSTTEIATTLIPRPAAQPPAEPRAALARPTARADRDRPGLLGAADHTRRHPPDQAQTQPSRGRPRPPRQGVPIIQQLGRKDAP